MVLDVWQGAGQSRCQSCFPVFEGQIKISETQDDMQIHGDENSDVSFLRYCWCVVIIISSVEHVLKVNSKKRRTSWCIPTTSTDVCVLEILQKAICHVIV